MVYNPGALRVQLEPPPARQRRIRQQERFQTLPVIALTAKALKDDREKCLDAGASDYLAKPVSGDPLLARLRFWLSRQSEHLSV